MSDEPAEAVAIDVPHPDDNGGLSIVQTCETDDETGELQIRRFRAYTHGLGGTIGSQGYYRVNEADPWTPAGVDWIQHTSEGTVYVIHRR